MTSTLDSEADAPLADRAWRAGDTVAAIETADRALAAGADPDCLAAGVAAAAATADGALFDAAHRWRLVSATLGGVPGAWAAGRAALAASLVGDVESAARDLTDARETLPASAPRGLAVLLDGVDAAMEAVRGGFDHAARRLAGLAVATVPADPFAPERWDDLAVSVMVAGGDDRTARDMVAAYADRPLTTRRRLLAAWLDLQAGRLADARNGLAAAGGLPILRRDAVFAAAITVGLARRAGGDDTLRATWHRVAPVVAGADVEVMLLDAWGELSVGAAKVSPVDRESIVDAMAVAVARAGSPSWGVAANHWWALQRAVAADDPVGAAEAAKALEALATGDRFALRAAAARSWASILASDVDPQAVAATAEALAEAGQAWEAAGLCGAAAVRLSDVPAPSALRAAGAEAHPQPSARELLAAGRGFRAKIATEDRAAGGGLSTRERSVGELLVDGLTHKEIGARLYISPKTVEQHVASLRRKLVAANRSELIAALRARLDGPSRDLRQVSQPNGKPPVRTV